MSLNDDIKNDVQNVIDKTWDLRKGQKVPNTEDVKLAGGAVELNATFLYADLANSSKMAKELDRRVAAKIMKSFLSTTCRLIRSLGGTVVSFDGDRVMGIFIGDSKNTTAAKCGLQIKYAVDNIIKPKFENKYDTVKNASFTISHAVGIDTGKIMGVRGGSHGANDLIWIGRAANLAAKLSDIRMTYKKTFITAAVYNMLNESSKREGSDKKNMWERTTYDYLGENITIYRSGYHWAP